MSTPTPATCSTECRRGAVHERRVPRHCRRVPCCVSHAPTSSSRRCGGRGSPSTPAHSLCASHRCARSDRAPAHVPAHGSHGRRGRTPLPPPLLLLKPPAATPSSGQAASAFPRLPPLSKTPGSTAAGATAAAATCLRGQATTGCLGPG